MIPLRGRLVAAMLAILALAACALPGTPRRQLQVWRLQPTSVRLQAAALPAQTLRLPQFGATAALDSAAMLYSPQPLQLLRYRDNRWLAPLPRMLHDALAQTLAAQPWVASVLQPGETAPAAAVLQCTLERFEHDVVAQRLRAQLRCTLRDADAHLRGHWDLQQAVAMQSNDAAGAAAAAQQAWDALSAALLPRVAAALAR